MCEVEFGDPTLRKVRLARKYELDGVAFIKDFEEPVGFTFYSARRESLSLTMEALEQAKKLYDFFKQLFKEPFAPMKKDSFLSSLNVDWELKTENKEDVLQKIEKTMSVEWRKAFDTIFSANDP